MKGTNLWKNNSSCWFCLFCADNSTYPQGEDVDTIFSLQLFENNRSQIPCNRGNHHTPQIKKWLTATFVEEIMVV